MRTGESVHRRKRNEGPQPRFQNLRANSSLPSLPSVRRFALVPKPGTLIHRKRNEGDSVGGTPTGATGTVALPDWGTGRLEREKRGHFQMSHRERVDKSHDQKGLQKRAEGRRQKAEGGLGKRSQKETKETKGTGELFKCGLREPKT